MSRKLLLVLMLMFAFTAAIYAQPAAVQRALDDLNQAAGTSYTLNSLAWEWSEEVFVENNLGCDRVGSTGSGSFRTYVIRFDVEFDGVFEWEYRVSTDGAIFIRCRNPPLGPVEVQPTVPPLPTSTPASCPGLPSRLSIGIVGRVELGGSPNVMRELPGRSAAYMTDIPVGGVFTVVDGPRCSEQFTWWRVDYNGTIGWTVESDGTEYWLEPFDPNATPTPTSDFAPITPVICSEAIPPRLTPNSFARVTEGEPNNVRAEPSPGAIRVGQIPGGESFYVLEGPVCTSNLAWWRVRYEDIEGWTPEGQVSEYWLEPVMVNFPTITVENAASLTALDQIALTNDPTAINAGAGRLYISTSNRLERWEASNPYGPISEVSWELSGFSGQVPGVYDQAYSILNGDTIAVVVGEDGIGINRLSPNGVETYLALPQIDKIFDINADGTRLLAGSTTDGLVNGLSVIEIGVDSPAAGTVILSLLDGTAIDDAMYTANEAHIAILTEQEILLINTGSLQPVATFPVLRPSFEFWVTNTNTQFALLNAEGTILDLINTQNTNTLIVEEAVIYSPTYSPDGSLLAYANETEVKVIDTATGTLLITLPIAARHVHFSADGRLLTLAYEGGVEIWGIIP
ncbi:MAG: SH3 domain-containing protein [Anaerolineae bacterium]|jgi:uncharacterized protein YraI|nr:SH3 domain-containing protein [Anaerolineae bacterium]